MVDAPQLPEWLARQYPFMPKSFLTANGARMSFVDEGPRTAEAVLMLHGNPTWSFYFRNLIRELAPTQRCIAPDHVGMGLSEKPADYDYTLATRIADLAGLVETLGLKRIHLVVHDWGGAIGFGFAARHPEMIGRLVVLNTAAFASTQIPARIALCKAPGFGPFLVRGFNGFAWPATWMAMHRRPLTPPQKRAYLFPYRSWAKRIAVSAFVRDIPLDASHVSWNTLAATEAGLVEFKDRPALIVWGGKDFCFNDSFLARWREILPGARCVRIADAGHYVLEDADAEVIPLIRDHLVPR
ncbi:MAG: alpha/beta hydrolase fold [Verrucomicrobia bacterium]|nr:alpha/beta hydrolase fold [Verrucomicrobiota bacterium]